MAADRTPVPHRLVVCTPLLAEYMAVRWGIRRARPGLPVDGPTAGDHCRVRTRVLRTGMGPARSRRAGAVLSHSLTAGRPPAASVVVAGVAGALTPQLCPGEVVVAGDVLGDEEPRALPDAAGLVRALRTAGLSVHVGPVVSTTRLRGDRSALHAETGAVAVDLESAFLAGALREASVHQFAVVRVVVDTPSAPLVHPRTVPNGVRALRLLARVAAALPAWAAAASASRPSPAGV